MSVTKFYLALLFISVKGITDEKVKIRSRPNIPSPNRDEIFLLAK